MGRPKIKIDPEKVKTMARLGLQNKDIATLSGCSIDTLEDRFSEELEVGRSELRGKLFQFAMRSAEQGNAQMQIFLLKNKCKLVDNVQVDSNVNGGMTIEIKSQADVLWQRIEQLARLKEEWSMKQLSPLELPPSASQ